MLLICLVLIILISDIELTLVQVYLFVMVSVRCMGFVCVCGRGVIQESRLLHLGIREREPFRGWRFSHICSRNLEIDGISSGNPRHKLFLGNFNCTRNLYVEFIRLLKE